MTILEELYYGNICPAVKSIKKNSEFSKILEEIVNLETSFTDKFDNEEKKDFEKFCELNSDLNDIRNLAVFKNGFQLGLGLAVNAFLDEDANFEDL